MNGAPAATEYSGDDAARDGNELKVLVLFAHPALHQSKAQRTLLAAARSVPRVTVHDLYEHYPDFDIDVPFEQQLLLKHDVVVVQHPFYWYSTPPIIKQWEDLVLAHGWAYGREGTALRGKVWMHAMSAGGTAQAYAADGHNRFTIPEMLRPLEQTAALCGMRWLPAFVVHGSHARSREQLLVQAQEYARLLAALRDNQVDHRAAGAMERINDDLDRVIGMESARRSHG